MQKDHQKVLLAQLPVPQTNFGRQTGNVPLAAAWLAQAAAEIGVQAEILPEAVVSYLGDAALLDLILSKKPDIIGFTGYCWNIDRTLALARQIKAEQSVRIVLGGPEITPDTPALANAQVDFLVYGEGERTFQRLLEDSFFWQNGSARGTAGDAFTGAPSPYLTGRIDPGPGNIMLVETQRGCPYRCSYCYYNKARSKMSFADETQVLKALTWAVERQVKEIYLLDPCLSARPQLHGLLEKLATLNGAGRIGLVSEIRAEAVNERLADLFQAAGFDWFEIGLQSTTPEALTLMNRKTDLKAFVAGAHRLKVRGISPRIDLILGLPGDTLDGFKRSVDFLVTHQLTEDVQLFPLSVLPGTDFRVKSQALGLTYTPAPPYTVLATPTFSREAMPAAIAYAEQALDTAFYPFPDLNIAWRSGSGQSVGDVRAALGGGQYYSKLYLDRPRPRHAIETVARRMSFPYQLFIDSSFSDHAALGQIMSILSRTNPYTPFEVVFLSPQRIPDCRKLLDAVCIKRPHFLDLEERFLRDRPGNRAVMFTIAGEETRRHPMEGMVRQVFRWRHDRLPGRRDLDALFNLDGLLIDADMPDAAIHQWQDRWAADADRLPAVSFSRIDHQHGWLMKTAPDQWVSSLLKGIG